MRTAVILGITGSIGATAIRGCNDFKDEIRITGASVNTSVEKAISICMQNGIRNLCVTSDAEVPETDGLTIWRDIREMVSFLQPDTVLNGIAGSAGLKASLDTIDAGCTLALANKESIVIGGTSLLEYARTKGVKVIPVDSEHSAIDELLIAHGSKDTDSLIITASGGPFRTTPLDEMANVTVEQATAHPTWRMGAKISIDSATLANKGLEVMEARTLFGFDADHIEVAIHPQSVVHSMIRMKSGQVYAQLSVPDMVFPIMRALLDRNVGHQVGKALDFTNLDLSFSKPDTVRFPMLSHAFECARLGGQYPAVYTIADEIAVSRFIQGDIGFMDIPGFVGDVLAMGWSTKPCDPFEALSAIDGIAGRIRER